MSLTKQQQYAVARASNQLQQQQINSHTETRRAAAKAIVISLLCELDCKDVADLFSNIDKNYEHI